MDRDIALQLSDVLTSVKNTLDQIAAGTVPEATEASLNLSDSRSLDPEEEPEAPVEEPETRTKK